MGLAAKSCLAGFLGLTLTGCTGLSGPVGQASCAASAAGQCDWLNDKTIYRVGFDLRYYHPSGRLYRLQTTEVSVNEWQVDSTGQNVFVYMSPAGKMGPAEKSWLLQNAEVLDGDPAGLTVNKRGHFIARNDERSLSQIIEDVRAR
ncbi:MAG: hypothetical protein AAGI92_12305 [Pseudomonadota bacterium]